MAKDNQSELMFAMEELVMNKDCIMVTVFCATYNHEKYIRQCLDGFLMQKTNFKFEVIIHEDASTDGTADIIREYEQKYPDIIKAIYEKENQFGKGWDYTDKFCLKIAKGKYIALCEGDDFWKDENKLQKQFDALESNPSCKMCVCKVRAVQEDGKDMEQTYPSSELQTGAYYTDEILNSICKEYAFQTSSYFLEKESVERYFSEKPAFFTVSPVGDWPMLLYFSLLNIYYIEDEMSCYRRNAIGSSCTVLQVSSQEKQLNYHRKMISMMEEFDKYTHYKYHEYCQTFNSRMHKHCYYLLLQEQNYKEIFSKKIYKQLLKQESKSDRLAIKCKYYFPWLFKLLYKLKKRNN